MQTPGESSRKHGPDVSPRTHCEQTRSVCKPRESLRKNMVRMQTPGKSSRKHGQDANPRKVFEKNGQDANPRRVFEKTRSRRKPQERLRENTGNQFLGSRGKTAWHWRFGHITAFHTCFYACFENRSARGPAERGGGRGKPPHPML